MSDLFWKDLPALVTGITGFVGSSLAARLVGLKARVVGLVRDDVAGSSFHQLGLEHAVTVVHGSLEDYPLLARTVNEYAVEVVYHLGAQTIVGTANRSPLSTFKSNIEGTWNLLEACRAHPGIRAVVVASSDKAYGTHKDLPYHEDFLLNPEYPYDVSKACADLLARSYFKTYGLPVVITRFANIYGPGDLNFSRIIPDTIQSVLQGRPPVIRSDGTPERDFLWIDDAIDAYLLMAEQIDTPGVKGEAFNAGSGKPVHILALVGEIIRLSGNHTLQPDIRGNVPPHGEINRQYLDVSKIRQVLGWEPKVPLEDGLKRVMDWYVGYLAHRGSPRA